MTALTAPQFTDETAAVAHLEASRWPDQVNCPHCGSVNVHRMAGKTQAGYFLCNDCRDKFTCRTGTVMERSHIPVHKWLLAIHLMSSNKNGVSAHELHRGLGISYKSAWFLAHRIREAMIDSNPAPMGGEGGQVQADETYYGNTSKRAKGYRIYVALSFQELYALDRKVFAIRFVTSDGKKIIVELPAAGAKLLRDKMLEAFSKHPEMEQWTGSNPN